MEAHFTFKICIFGDGGVGKTTLTRHFLTGFFEDDTKLTMGASIFVHFIDVGNFRVALQIWDFGGEEEFRFLLPDYSLGSSAGIYMFDISRLSSLDAAEEWLSYFNKSLVRDGQEIPILLVGGKSDLAKERSVSREHAEKTQRDCNFYDYIECSSKSGENVDKVLNSIFSTVTKNRFSQD